MYKLFVNNYQVGSYGTLRDMMKSALLKHCYGKFTENLKWVGNSLYIENF